MFREDATSSLPWLGGVGVILRLSLGLGSGLDLELELGQGSLNYILHLTIVHLPRIRQRYGGRTDVEGCVGGGRGGVLTDPDKG